MRFDDVCVDKNGALTDMKFIDIIRKRHTAQERYRGKTAKQQVHKKDWEKNPMQIIIRLVNIA